MPQSSADAALMTLSAQHPLTVSSARNAKATAMTESSRTTAKHDLLKWIEQYTQQAREHVQCLREDPGADRQRREVAEAMLEIVDPAFHLASIDTGIEGGEVTIETEAGFMWPPHD
ncbi:hypothetical protein WG899_06015 [Paucibacter sp. AS339]|uniref:hypothetical protein n=1 Tax=Paucibacter hankyongi TaxID=3133434 RepID=UPI0030A4041D